MPGRNGRADISPPAATSLGIFVGFNRRHSLAQVILIIIKGFCETLCLKFGQSPAVGWQDKLSTVHGEFFTDRRKEMCSTQRKLYRAVLFCVAALWMTNFLRPALAADEDWKAKMIADALLAAPPSVTATAKIYAWTDKGELTMVRDGDGPYTCVASGSFSARIGKPPLPHPDPMCMDPNGWAFLRAVWAEKTPLTPAKPYPNSPGLVWMLGGMNVDKGAVALGAGQETKITAEKGGGNVYQMTPHIMIMPLPSDKKIATLSTKYDLEHPLHSWIMAAGTPYEHLMVHLSAEDVKAMMEAGK